jgi:thiol-disulfide isomerase/thioredoxin
MKRAIALLSIGIGVLLIAASIFVFRGEAEGDSFLNLRDGNSKNREDQNTTTADGPDEGNENIPTAPQTGAYAPNFTLESTSGHIVQLSDYQGKVVLLNFWAVWCPPCREEMPAIQSVHESYGDQLVVLSVNAGDTRADTIDFLNSLGLTFETVLDSDNKVDDQYRVRGIPTTFFIDQQGIIQFLHVGNMSESQITGYLADMGLPD